MKLCSNSLLIERAQPWLGTLVSMKIQGLEVEEGHKAIDAAFAEIAAVHRLMSFHERNSDIGRLNRSAALGPVTVHPYTFEVLQWAQKISEDSDGCFDISVGSKLVELDLLPSPADGPGPENGSWRDIELMPEYQVRFHRPLWIDLGGIAKGYAVDKATECLRSYGVVSSVVNAGGDIRIQGESPELIRLGVPWLEEWECERDVPVLEITNASVAGSSSQLDKPHGSRTFGPHIHGRDRSPAPGGRFTCVVAERCLIADALTKTAMAMGVESAELLRQYEASAYIHDSVGIWEHIGREMESA